MLTTIRSQIDEIEIINILKQPSAKKTERERVIKVPAFLFVAIWSQLVHSWPGLTYMGKSKHKTLENR